jgi:hypothetical protein
MKKTVLTFLFTLVVSIGFAQMHMHPPRQFKMPHIDIRQYEVVDSFPLERITIYSPYDYSGDEVIQLGTGQYLIEMPYPDKMIIRTNKDRTKAIVVYNSYCFGRHKEFNVKETDRRIVLWYEDDDGLYCGYTYDKKYKVCKYFESH